MDLIAGNDVVKRVLFHAAYDFYFWIGAIVINVIVWILAFYFKIKKWGTNFIFFVVEIALILFLLFVPIIFGGIGSEKIDGSDTAKENLRAYINGEYLYTEAYCTGYRSFDYVDKTRGVMERVYRLNIDGSFVKMEDIHHR